MRNVAAITMKKQYLPPGLWMWNIPAMYLVTMTAFYDDIFMVELYVCRGQYQIPGWKINEPALKNINNDGKQDIN